MVTVGVRDLKNQLSSYLRMVKGGETVVVMDHSEVVAEIKRPSQTGGGDSRINQFIRDGLKGGRIVPAKRAVSEISKESLKNRRKMDWKKAYEEARDERS